MTSEEFSSLNGSSPPLSCPPHVAKALGRTPVFQYLAKPAKRLPRRIIGTLMALRGAVWLTASDFWVSRQTLLGDITCFVSMLLFSFFIHAMAATAGGERAAETASTPEV